MSIQRPRRIDRDTAEQLLAGAPEPHPPLAALLAAAAAPGRPDELAREQAIIAAFRSAQLAPARRPRALSTIRSAALKVLTVKAAMALAATTAGGVALAASTGKLPNPLAAHPPAATSGLSTAPPTATQSFAEHDNDAAPATPGSPDGSEGPDSSHAPSPSLVGLCQAYSSATKAKPKASRSAAPRPGVDRSATAKSKPDDTGDGKSTGNDLLDKLLDNPAFRALVAAAGGKDKVEGFCASPTPTSSATPRVGRPTADPRGNQHNGKSTEN